MSDHIVQAVDDDEINCQIPTAAPPGSSLNLEYCNVLIKISQLSSLVAKKLSSVRAFRMSAEFAVKSVLQLDEQLNAVKRSVQPVLDLDSPINPNQLPGSLSLKHVVYLQCAYFSTILDIHTFFSCPWGRNLLGLTPHPVLCAQAERSTQIVAETCRRAILATVHIHPDASTPVP